MIAAAFARFKPLVRPQASRIGALTGLAVLGIAVDALLPWPLKLIIDHVIAHDPLPPVVEWIAALPGSASPAGMLAWLAVAMLALFLATAGLRLAESVLQSDISSRLRLGLAGAVFDRLQSLSLVWHRRGRRGDLVRRITNDSGCLSTIVIGVALPLLMSTMTLIVLFVIMWQLDPQLAIVASLAALPMSMLMRVFGARMTERSYQHQEAEGTVWAVAEQTLAAIPVVQGFGREEHESTRFRAVADQSIAAYLHTLSSEIQFRIGIDASEVFGVSAVMIVGGLHVLAGNISIGTLVVFLSYVTALYAPLLTFAYLAMTLASATASARRVEQVLDADDRVVDVAGAVPLIASGAGARRGEVRFEHITFGYEPGYPILRDIDLEARIGETIALVGSSGAGKSTLVSLVPRLHDPWQGRMLIEGQDIRKATIDSVRERIALVLQDPFLLPISVAENIAYGRPSATRADIVAAATMAAADEFIRRMPHGYETVIGERGVRLSGGQRQRLSIARALLRDAPILIMDEPTSALDMATEAEMLDAIGRLTAERTTFVIAHRLSTVRRADRIVVLDDGKIVASGSHHALMASSHHYRTLHSTSLIRDVPPEPSAVQEAD